MNEFFRYFSNEKTKDTKPSWETLKPMSCYQDLYMQALGFITSETKSDNIDTIYGTTKGFMEKLQSLFVEGKDKLEEDIKNMTGREINAYLLYTTEPKSLLDCFWLGHFIGALTHFLFTQNGTFYQNGFHTNIND